MLFSHLDDEDMKYGKFLIFNYFFIFQLLFIPIAAGLRHGVVDKVKDRFEAERLQVGDDVFDCILLHWTSWFSLSYNQAFMLGLIFGSMSCKAHQTHIALSEPMISIVQQGSSLSLSLTSTSLNPHYN